MSAEPSPASSPDREPVSPLRAGGDLFLISLLILFLELACIRWFPAHVLFLTFFTNTVLLACFLGMSVGCLAAGRPQNYLRWTPGVLAITMLVALVFDLLNRQLDFLVDVGGQNNPQVVFFGTEYRYRAALRPPFDIPIEAVAGFFFVMIALALIGPGQE